MLGEELSIRVEELEDGIDGGKPKLDCEHGKVQRLAGAGFHDKKVFFLVAVERAIEDDGALGEVDRAAGLRPLGVVLDLEAQPIRGTGGALDPDPPQPWSGIGRDRKAHLRLAGRRAQDLAFDRRARDAGRLERHRVGEGQAVVLRGPHRDEPDRAYILEARASERHGGRRALTPTKREGRAQKRSLRNA